MPPPLFTNKYRRRLISHRSTKFRFSSLASMEVSHHLLTSWLRLELWICRRESTALYTHSEMPWIDLLRSKALLLAPPNDIGRPQHSLKTGIYCVVDASPPLSKQRRGYLIYWPEYTTWDDDSISAIKRNRVTFMRYPSISTVESVTVC